MLSSLTSSTCDIGGELSPGRFGFGLRLGSEGAVALGSRSAGLDGGDRAQHGGNRRRAGYTLPGHQSPGLAVSPDGTRFVRQEGEGRQHDWLVVRDLQTAEEIVELGPPGKSGIRAHRLRWSPDGSMIAAAFDSDVAVWDSVTGSLLFAQEPDPDRIHTADLLFSPDSARLVTSSRDFMVRAFSTESWELVTEQDQYVDGASRLGLVGHTFDGATMLAAGAFLGSSSGAVHWFDTDTLRPTRSKENAHDGAIHAMALRPDGSRIATGSSDGFVRVWDVATSDLLHEIPFGGTQVEGVAFVDDHRLAVTLEHGNLLIATTDLDELLEIVSASLTRGFTATECEKSDFDDDCPTLMELRGAPPGTDDPSVLNGTYRVDWPADDLVVEFMAAGDSKEFAVDGAERWAGNHEATFTDGRFEFVRRTDVVEPLCTGSYSIRDDRVWLTAERGTECDGRIKFFDATFTLTDNELRLDDFRGGFSEEILFGSRQLQKID